MKERRELVRFGFCDFVYFSHLVRVQFKYNKIIIINNN